MNIRGASTVALILVLGCWCMGCEPAGKPNDATNKTETTPLSRDPGYWLKKAEAELKHAAIDETTREMMLISILSEWAIRGELDHVLAFAQTPPLTDARVRSAMVASFVGGFVEGGHFDAAIRLIEEWCDSDQSRSLCYLIAGLKASGQWEFDQAYEFLKRSKLDADDGTYQMFLGGVALSLAQSGRIEEAQLTIAKVEPTVFLSKAVRKVIDHHVQIRELNDIGESKGPPPAFFEGLGHYEDKIHGGFFRALLADRVDIVERHLPGLADQSEAAKTWMYVAWTHLHRQRRADMRIALERGEAIRLKLGPQQIEHVNLGEYLAMRFFVLAHAGMEPQARETLALMNASFARGVKGRTSDQMMDAVIHDPMFVEALTLLGDEDRIIERLMKMSERPIERALSITALTRAMVKSDRMEQCAKLVESLDDPGDRCSGWIGIVRGLRKP